MPTSHSPALVADDPLAQADVKSDPKLQTQVEAIDASLRARFGMEAEHTSVGLFDFRTRGVALIRADHIEYGASVPKIGILLAWFETHPDAATRLDPGIRRRLELMIKHSSNEEAARFSQEIGLARVRSCLGAHGFYDAAHGGGIWVGKHYGVDGERTLDPVGGHSHAVTARQVLRFLVLLETDQLVSPDASLTMREIFDAPQLAHLPDKFVLGLEGHPVRIRRKSGTWEDWRHDAVVVTGTGRHYALVALTHHPRGDEYLTELARAVDALECGALEAPQFPAPRDGSKGGAADASTRR